MNHMSRLSQERIKQIRKNAETYVPSAEAIAAKFAKELREEIALKLARAAIKKAMCK